MSNITTAPYQHQSQHIVTKRLLQTSMYFTAHFFVCQDVDEKTPKTPKIDAPKRMGGGPNEKGATNEPISLTVSGSGLSRCSESRSDGRSRDGEG